jgi:CBS domain-containing protein
METEFVSFRPGAPLAAAAATFVHDHRQVRDAQAAQRLYPVTTADGCLLGVVTRRDMLDAALGADDLPANAIVRDLLLREPVVAYPDLTLREAANLMEEHHVSRTPVVEREHPGRIVGFLTLVDLLQGRRIDIEEERVSERVLTVRQLFPLGGAVQRARLSGEVDEQAVDDGRLRTG